MASADRRLKRGRDRSARVETEVSFVGPKPDRAPEPAGNFPECINGLDWANGRAAEKESGGLAGSRRVR
jgi:hypothetical protein